MLAAALALYLAFGDDEAGPQIGFAAYDQEQAKLRYSAARHMVVRDLRPVSEAGTGA